MARPKVLMISKPIAPPWKDSGKNIVKSIVDFAPECDFHILSPQGYTHPGPHVHTEPLYQALGAYSPSLSQNMKVMLRLLKPDDLAIYHFFFAPNPLSSKAARLALWLKRRVSIHTVCSSPRSYEGLKHLMFADHVVVLSEMNRRRFAEAGIEATVIPPGIDPGPKATLEARQALRRKLKLPGGPLVLYPGDLEFSKAAKVTARAIRRVVQAEPEVVFLFACRLKSEAAKRAELEIRAFVRAEGLEAHARFVNEVDDIPALLAEATMVVLPADDLYAKMDIPLVLLETLAQERPVVIANVEPIKELMRAEVGLMVPPGDHEELAYAIVWLLENEQARTRMGRAGRALVEGPFHASTQARAYADLYRRVGV